MSAILYFILIPIIIYFTNYVVTEFQILKNYFVKDNIPYTGSFILTISLLFILRDNLSLNFIYFFLLIIAVLFTQKISIKLGNLKIIIQFFAITILVIFFKLDGYIQTLNITSVRIFFLDFFLRFEFFSYLFVIIFIILNIFGTKKIDNLNGLSVGYFFILSFVAFLISPDSFKNKFSLIISDNQILLFLITTFFLTLFSMLNKIKVGETGLYLFGTILPIYTILMYKHTINISPFFILLMFWYPCFELILSFVRKIYFKSRSDVMINESFHDLLNIYLEKKFSKSKFQSNNFTIIIINLFNLLSIFIGSLNFFKPKIVIFLLVTNIVVYMICYLRLIKFRLNN